MQAIGRSIWTPLAIAVAAALVGVVGLRFIFGSLPDPTQSVLWLGLAVVSCVCLLLPSRPLADTLAALLTRVPEGRGVQSTWSRQAAKDVARLMVAAGLLLVLQSILRHPMVAVFGTSAEPLLIESAIAIFALLVLLVLLGSLYRAARPLLEGLAWAGLDSLFATSRSEEAAEVADTLGPIVTPTLARPAGATATVTHVVRTPKSVAETLTDPAQVKR
jgi:hypothetical protein